MKTSRFVKVALVVLVCVALVLATTEVSAARASPKVAVAKTSATASSMWAQGRAVTESAAGSCSRAAREAAAWVRSLCAACRQCAEHTCTRVQQACGNTWRAVSQCMTRCVSTCRVAFTKCISCANAIGHSVCAAATSAVAKVSAAIPDCVKPFAEDVMHGVCSVVMVRRHFTTQAAGNIPETPSSRSEAILSYTTAKFLYGLSAGLTELVLLRVLYREPHGNHRTNCWNRFFASIIGWPIMLAAVAVPNGLVEAGMMLVMVLKLSPSSFRPAIVLGHLVRPYMVAVLRTCPCLGRVYAAYQGLWPAKAMPSGNVTAVAEVLLWAAVVWAIMFLSSAMNKKEEDEETPMSGASSGDEEEEEAQVSSAVPAAANKSRAKASPAAARRPRKNTRSSSRR